MMEEVGGLVAQAGGFVGVGGGERVGEKEECSCLPGAGVPVFEHVEAQGHRPDAGGDVVAAGVGEGVAAQYPGAGLVVVRGRRETRVAELVDCVVEELDHLWPCGEAPGRVTRAEVCRARPRGEVGLAPGFRGLGEQAGGVPGAVVLGGEEC
ncbi:hypothetical protein ACIQXD_01365 [Streptomyces uncialis]|uniref:hypothetical protein n=1 Tax=Streptomyces uncialis TaxID=1048205 RepID=UPI003804B7AA